MTKTIKTIDFVGSEGEVTITKTNRRIGFNDGKRSLSGIIWEGRDGTFWVNYDGWFNRVVPVQSGVWTRSPNEEYGKEV